METAHPNGNIQASDRTCGAACLSVVYEALGAPTAQEEIWPAIAKQNALGSVASTTHLMVCDAIQRGFPAIAIQALHPLQALRMCQSNGLQAILNLRTNKSSAAGHYSVLVEIDQTHAVLRDSLTNPPRRLSYQQTLELWQPCLGQCEISGNVLIAIGGRDAGSGRCGICGVQTVEEIECMGCNSVVPLKPAAVLGCTVENCIARTWRYILCPHCDKLIDATGAPARTLTPQQQSEAATHKLFAALDHFTSVVSAIPGAQNCSDLQTPLTAIAGQREKLKTLYTEFHGRSAYIMSHYTDVARMYEQAKANAAPLQPPPPEPPPERLDGHELGAALLKNLGIRA